MRGEHKASQILVFGFTELHNPEVSILHIGPWHMALAFRQMRGVEVISPNPIGYLEGPGASPKSRQL